MRNEELNTIIEKSFRTEPDLYLPVNFAQKVTFSVIRQEKWKNDLFDYLYLTGVIVLLLAAAGGLYYYIDKEFILKFLSFLSGNVLQVILVVFLLNFILFADRVLLPLLFRSLPLPPPKEGAKNRYA